MMTHRNALKVFLLTIVTCAVSVPAVANERDLQSIASLSNSHANEKRAEIERSIANCEYYKGLLINEPHNFYTRDGGGWATYMVNGESVFARTENFQMNGRHAKNSCELERNSFTLDKVVTDEYECHELTDYGWRKYMGLQDTEYTIKNGKLTKYWRSKCGPKVSKIQEEELYRKIPSTNFAIKSTLDDIQRAIDNMRLELKDI